MVNHGLSLAPNDLHLLETRGTILIKLPDRLDDARRDFERLVDRSPAGTRRKAKALLQLGLICARFKDMAQANQHLTHALGIDQENEPGEGGEPELLGMLLADFLDGLLQVNPPSKRIQSSLPGGPSSRRGRSSGSVRREKRPSSRSSRSRR